MEGYDDIITFGRVLAHVWDGSDNIVESLFGYLEAPHKWDGEYRKWRELGGTLDDKCLAAFERWYEDHLLAQVFGDEEEQL